MLEVDGSAQFVGRLFQGRPIVIQRKEVGFRESHCYTFANAPDDDLPVPYNGTQHVVVHCQCLE